MTLLRFDRGRVGLTLPQARAWSCGFALILRIHSVALFAVGQQQIVRMTETHLRLFKQIEDLKHAWSESVQRAREAETDGV